MVKTMKTKKPYYKRLAKKVYKAAKKRYYSKGNLNVAKIASDVKWVKSVLNPEKKRYDVTFNGITFGQVYNNTSGAYSLDITPTPAQGVGYNQHTGSSIKLHTAVIKFQGWSQSSNTHKTKFSFEIWRVDGTSYATPSTLMSQLYQVSSMSGVIDLNSQLDPDYSGTAKRIYMRTLTNAHNYSSEVAITTKLFPLRFQKHVRFNDDSTTVTDGQLILIIRADAGNNGTVASSVSNIPITHATSGIQANMDCKWYYYDN